MHFCACPIQCKVHWRVDRRLGSCTLISVQPLIGSTIRAFYIALLCGYWRFCVVNTDTNRSLSNRSQHVMVDGCRCKLVDVISGVQQGSVLGSIIIIQIIIIIIISTIEFSINGRSTEKLLVLTHFLSPNYQLTVIYFNFVWCWGSVVMLTPLN